MWTKEGVDNALRSYIDDKARVLHLEVEIAEVERQVSTAADDLADTSVKAQQLTGMPHGTGISNPTENIGMKLASGWLPPEIKEMQNELSKLREEYTVKAARVRFVEAWMGALSEREYWIILHQFMRQEFWRDILVDYDKQFGGYATKDTLKGLRAKAFKTVYAAAGIKN